MMKLTIKKARIRVSARYHLQGSVLAQTVKASVPGVSVHLEVESDDPPEKVAAAIRNAENGCFTLQALKNPVEVQTEVRLNGDGLDLDGFSPPNKK